MAASTAFNTGDMVMHPRRMEWGEGVVNHASNITHQGVSAQKLQVDFKHHGRVTINTAIAPLVSRESVSAMSTSTPTGMGQGWLSSLEEQNKTEHELWQLPESLTDPFLSTAVRLRNVLDTYRFSISRSDPNSAKSILEWAIAQTGLTDPMTRYTRQEMEQAFPRYARSRDNLLADMVLTLKKQGSKDLLQKVYSDTRHPAAKAALEKRLRH